MKTMKPVALEVRLKEIPTRILDFLACGVLVSLLVAILSATLLAIYRVFWGLPVLLHGDVVQSIKQVVIGVVAILALVEVYRTAYLYFTKGRVKVTYVVDTVLVVLMTDILSVWYARSDYWRVSAAVALLLALGLMRLLAIRYSPVGEE